MNLSIILGKIVSEIEFKFIINGKNKSIVYFSLELLNKGIIKIKAYNEMADVVFRKLKREQIIIIEGELREDGTIECKQFEVLQ